MSQKAIYKKQAALKNRLELRLLNSIAELQVLNTRLEQLGQNWNLSPDLISNLNLVLEEIFTNIIYYGYDDSAVHPVELNITLKGEVIKIEIIDDAKPFNPLERLNPDLDQSLESRQVGGLGIFLVKQIMDEADYLRQNGKNILTLQKNIKNPNPATSKTG